jgi:Zn-finger nucleic acid-binding protein
MPMKCPKDGTAMRERDVDGVVLDVCEKCGGIWMDWGELGRVSKHTVTEHELVFRGGSSRHCPRCGKPMKKADLHSVIVEECGCGIFFDRGEADKVIGRGIEANVSSGSAKVEMTLAQVKELLDRGAVKAGPVEIVLRR